jgi:hypothetical protein
MQANTFDIISFTADIDWAPDFLIDEMAQTFIDHEIKCTWFVTHESAAVDRLKESKYFELGIHPNFHEGSSHGKTEDEVIQFCKKMLPKTRVVRMHALHQNSYLLRKLQNEYDIDIDCSLFLPHTSNLIPHLFYHDRHRKPLFRIPFNWEDDVECLTPHQTWVFDPGILTRQGIKMFNFHPMYVGINESDFQQYSSIKSQLCRNKKLSELEASELAPYINNGMGVKTFLRSLLQYVQRNKLATYWPSEIESLYHQQMKSEQVNFS